MTSRKLLAAAAFITVVGGGVYVLAPGTPAPVAPDRPATMATYERPAPSAAPVFHPYWEHGRAPMQASPVPALPPAPAPAPAAAVSVESRAAEAAAPADVSAQPSGWPRFDREDLAQSALGARHAASRAGQPLPPSAHAPLVPGAQQVRRHLLSHGTR